MEREIQWILRLCESEWNQLFGKFQWKTKSSYTQYKFESGWSERFGLDYKLSHELNDENENIHLIHLFKRPIDINGVRLLFNHKKDWEVNVKFPIVMILKSAEETTEVPQTDKKIFTFGPSFSQLHDVPIDSTTFTRYRFTRGNWRFSLTKRLFQAEPYFSFEAENEQWAEMPDLSTFFETIEPIYQIVKLLDFGPLYAPRTVPKAFTLLPVEHDEVKIKYDGICKLITVYNNSINADLKIEPFQHFVLQLEEVTEEVTTQQATKNITKYILTELCSIRNFSTASNLLYGTVKPLVASGTKTMSISIRDSNFWLKQFPDKIGQVYVSKPIQKTCVARPILGMPTDGLLAIGSRRYQKIKKHQTIELLHKDGELFALERSLSKLKLKINASCQKLPDGILEFAVTNNYKVIKYVRLRTDKHEPDTFVKIIQHLKLKIEDLV